MFEPLESVARAAFADRFVGEPTAMGLAPGRVELLGNHTDYNGGLVLAAAINRFTVVVGRSVGGRTARVLSVHFDELDTFSVDTIEPGEAGSWKRYVRGVAWTLQERSGPLASGFEAALVGNVPLGTGLSSSASLEAAFAMFLRQVGQGGANDLDDLSRMELAHALRRAENAFVGVASGLLDQFSSLFGRAEQALLLDCRSLEFDRLPMGQPAPAIVVCDSKTSRRLADGMYNQRRDECNRVVDHFQKRRGIESVQSLRDLTIEDLQADWHDLDPVGRRRARHVLTENARVRQGAEALRIGDVAELGRWMSASHVSSRDDFENSSKALDDLIEIAETAPGHLGGKLSGAGWAGCTVHLVVPDQAEAFADAMRTGSTRRTGTEPVIHVCKAAGGATGRSFT
ncbi:galactokinase [soil metagenome]